MATQAQIDQFIRDFYQSWDRSLKDRQAYNTAIAIAETKTGLQVGRAIGAPAGIDLNLISPNDIPSFDSLKATSGTPYPSPPAVAAPTPPTEDPGANRVPPAYNSVQTNPVDGAAPPPPDQTNPGDNLADEDNPQASTVNAAGQNIGIEVSDESGIQSARINPETGQLYDPGDIALPNSSNATVSGVVNPVSRPRIFPQPNVLDKFSSYTYRLSVYLMTPQQYEQFVKTKKKNLSGYNLLIQSGGAPNNTSGFLGALNSQNQAAAAATAGIAEATPEEIAAVSARYDTTSTTAGTNAGRNPAFPLDFYIDSCTINTLSQGAGTGISHTADSMKFTVIEPVGITLIDRIYEAVQDMAPKDSTNSVNYQNAQYLMVIRWYGYDENGNVVGGSPNNTDPRAVVEKYIPFSIAKINWRVQSKATEYEFECIPTNQWVATGTRRGVVPYDIQLSQGTVGALLAGSLAYTDRTGTAAAPGGTTTIETEAAINEETGDVYQRIKAPPKANAAGTSKPAVKQGLMAAMNEFSRNLTQGKTAVYEIADQYEIVFAPGAEAIRDATIVLPGKKIEAKLTPMSQPATANPQSLNPDTNSKDNTISSKYIFAGQSIVQVIDQVIRNSSYITSQALTRYEGDQEVINDDAEKKNKPVNWFRINFQAVPIGNKADKFRNDYAYKIRYIISAYKIDNYDSKYFPLGSFRGVHKSYPYWFTGKNTAVLDYSEQLNSAYNMLVSGSDPTDSAAERERRKIAATMRELVTYTWGPASSETRQGARGKGNEQSANLADSLYTGADLANSKLKIIGDPAWIQQGSLVGGISSDLFVADSFLPDGTINYDAEQINYEVTWSRPADYDLQTGVANPAAINKPPISRVYTTRSVLHEFKQGTFTQTIDGLLFNLPKPDGSNKAATAAMPTKTGEGRTSGNTTQAVAGRTGVDLTTEAGQAARRSFAAADPRRVDRAAAAGADNPAMTSSPPSPLPTPSNSTAGNGSVQTVNDTVRPEPPPEPATSNGDVDTGDFFADSPRLGPGSDAPTVGAPQDQAWEP